MKMVMAIIRPHTLKKVEKRLVDLGLTRLTITPVGELNVDEGFYKLETLTYIKLEVVVHADKVSNVVKIISTVAKTGRPGDGVIFIYPVERAIKVRTGEEGAAAL